MKNFKPIYTLFLIVALVTFAVPMYAVVVDSTSNAQLAAHLLTNIYKQYAPQGSTYLTLFFIILAGTGIPLLAKFQAELKADPTKQPIAGVTGWALNVLTFFVDDVQSGDPAVKKKE